MVEDMEYITRDNQKYEVLYHKGRIRSRLIQEFVYYRGILPCLDEFLTKRIHKSLPNSNDSLFKALKLVLEMKANVLNDLYTKKLRSTIEKFKVYAKPIYNQVYNRPAKL